MGKQGPCYHCGVTSTPLWRNGPPEKPVLCNACGSRWRTKGTLANYTPLHSRADPDEFEDYKVSRVKSISLKNKEPKVLKRKQNYHASAVATTVAPDYNRGCHKAVDEDTSNRSSSGSAISNTESCAQFGGADASDLTGPAHSIVWDTSFPSRKRTCISRQKPSSVEKLTQDLYTILHEEQSPYFSRSSEDDLLFESNTPLVSFEIGHGSVLIRHPNSIAREEESEASSLTVDNKHCLANEAYSQLTPPPVHTTDMWGINYLSPGIEKINEPAGKGLQREQVKRVKAPPEKLQFLGNHNSPLSYVNLKDILNFDKFSNHLTNEEQQQLLKYLPSVDTTELPVSLMSMFDSPQFEENLFSFQKLLAEGAFDLSFPGVKSEECKTLKRLSLCSLTKSKWVEQYNLLKDTKTEYCDGGSPEVGGLNAIAFGNSVNLKRSQDGQNQNYYPGSTTINKPKRVAMKDIDEHKELIVNDGSSFSPRNLFALPPDNSNLHMLGSFQYGGDEYSDQDLLLDVPSNSSFPQAELLYPPSSYYGAQASGSSSSIYPHFRF